MAEHTIDCRHACTDGREPCNCQARASQAAALFAMAPTKAGLR